MFIDSFVYLCICYFDNNFAYFFLLILKEHLVRFLDDQEATYAVSESSLTEDIGINIAAIQVEFTRKVELGSSEGKSMDRGHHFNISVVAPWIHTAHVLFVPCIGCL